MQFIFKIGDKIQEGWVIYKAHFSTLLVMTIITMIVQFVGGKDDFPLAVIALIVNLLISYIWIRFTLNLVDKKDFNPFSKEALPSITQLWNFIKTGILYALCILGGFILLIIPAFYISGRLIFAIYLSVEKNQGGRASIKEAWEMTRGYGWKLFWKSLVIGLFMALGFIAFFIGSFVTYPIGFMLMVMMYREFVKFKLQTPASSTPLEVVKEIPTEVVEEKVVQEESK